MSDINYQKQLFLWYKNTGSAPKTYEAYRRILNKILNDIPDLETATIERLQEYTAGISNDNTRKNTCMMIRWVFNTLLKRPIDWRDLPYPKRKRKVQPIYSHEEAMLILNSVTNEKQKAILALIIDQGLRISEPCGILIKDCKLAPVAQRCC